MRKGSHTQYDIQYHIVWTTKYRYEVLTGKVAQRLRILLMQGCAARGITIIRGNITKNHVHMLVSCPPSMAPSKLIQYLKGRSSKILQEELPDLTSTLLTSVIIFGQGLPQRFSNNTPSGRKEILEQSIQKFREVLNDFNFGDLYVDGKTPSQINHLFMSIQSFVSSDFVNKTTDDFYLQVSMLAGKQMKEKENTLIFIDEIQAYPHLLTLLKFLSQDNKYTYIASRSLLGVTLSQTTSIPMGSIRKIRMFPLDFE